MEVATPAAPPMAAGVGSDRAAVASERSVSGVAEVEIRGASGAPLAAASWVIFRGEQVLGTGATAEDGLARFQREAGRGGLAALPPSGALQCFELDLAAGRQIIVLAAGSAVAGRVRVDGREPAEPLTLLLYPGLRPGFLPEPVLEALGGGASGFIQTTTAAGGAFRFDGLPKDWSGTLGWTGELFVSQEDASPGQRLEESVRLAAPGEGLQVELTAGSILTGTVVDPLTRAGIEAAVSARFISDDHEAEESAETGLDGRFSFSFPSALPEWIEISASRPEGAGTGKMEFGLPRGAWILDVGPIEVLPTRTVRFTVRDLAGRPIARAKVRAQPFDEDCCAHSDDAGMGSLCLPLAARGLRVIAEGFEPAEVALPPGDELVEVVMRPGTVLEVRVLTPGPHSRVFPSSGEGLFLDQGVPSWRPETQGVWSSGISSDGEQVEVTFSGREDGVYSLSGVRPGIAIALELVDPFGTQLETVVPPLWSGEHRIVELALPGATRSLAGRVVDASGSPIPGARVCVGAVRSQQFCAMVTDDAGRFRFDGIHAASMRLVVEASHHATLAIEEQPVLRQPLELVLDAGREVEVAVVGPRGEPVPIGWVVTRNESGYTTAYARPVEPGTYVFDYAPRSACTLVVIAGTSEFQQLLPEGATETSIELPTWSPCTVRVKGWAGRPLSDLSFVVVRRLDGDSQRRTDQHRSRSSKDEVRFDALFKGRYEAFVAHFGSPGMLLERLSEAVEFEVPDPSGEQVRVTLFLDAR